MTIKKCLPQYLADPLVASRLDIMRAMIDQSRELLPQSVAEGSLTLKQHNHLQDLVDALERAWEVHDWQKGEEIMTRINQRMEQIGVMQFNKRP